MSQRDMKEWIDRSKPDPRRDASDPPPDSRTWADRQREARLLAAEKHARWVEAAKKIVVGGGAILTVVGALLWAIFTYGVNRAVDARFEQLRGSLDPAVLRPTDEELERRKRTGERIPPSIGDRFDEVKAMIADTQKAIDAPNNPNTELGKKLDSVQKSLNIIFADKPSPGSVGPTAKQQGRQ